MEYLSPGVYIEEIPTDSRVIEQVSTCIACFVGFAIKGPTSEANLIKSFSEYTDIHGEIFSEDDAMGFAVQAFYGNGGTSAYVCRLAGEDAEPNSREPTKATTREFKKFYDSVLSKISDISIIVVPGEQWPQDGTENSILRESLAHCERLKDRMLIFDPPMNFKIDQAKKIYQLSLPSSSYCAFYYPWVKVENPFYDAQDPLHKNQEVTIAPSALAVGVWNNTDISRGVWKAPAGAEASLTGIAGLEYTVGDAEQAIMNPVGVNCLRNLPGMGMVIWGARTLIASAEPEWSYIPVRRTAIMIEQSIYHGIEWVVFEPNDHRLWSVLKGMVNNFMNELFRLGAFQGEKASDGYFVQCGLGETMTQADIDVGRVNMLVGFAPLKPGEFIVIRIGQKLNQQ